jgi:hypothetical protein
LRRRWRSRPPKRHGNRKADAAASKQLAKVPPHADGPLIEVLGHRFPKHAGVVCGRRCSLQVNHQSQRSVRGKIGAPIDNEFLPWIKIALAKW